MASINEIKSIASSRLGFARTNSFLVELPNLSGGGLVGGILGSFVPSIPGVVGGGPASTREMNILCKNATIPGKQILTHDRRIGMSYEKIAYGFAVDSVTLTFYLLNDYGVMNYFENWRKQVLNEEDFTVGYKSEYQKPVTIHQLRKPLVGLSGGVGPIRVNVGLGGGSVYSVKLNEAFPTTINSISFSNEQDGLAEVSVTLSYTNWETVSPSQNFINASIGF